MPVVVAAAVIIRDGRVLLTRRAQGQHLAGMWEFPGGKLEDGESPAEALVRECQEECGVEVEVGEILDVTHYRYPEKDVLLLFYRCEVRAGEVRHLQVADHAWVAPPDLNNYPLPPADEPVVARIRALHGERRLAGARAFDDDAADEASFVGGHRHGLGENDNR